MNVGRALSRLAARAAALGLAAGYVGLAVAADEPARVAPAAPAVAAPEICPTCTAGDARAPGGKAGCARCGHRAGCNPKKPVVGELRPGACFGYFQTQWHRWENVCPLPYQGVGIPDAPQGLPLPGSTGITPKAAPVPKSDAPMPLPMNTTPPTKTGTAPAPTPPAKGITTSPTPAIPAPPAPPENKFGK
jgi:hypothetical protein